MKRSALKEFIREEIIEILSEASPEEVEAQKELNAELEKTADLKKKLDSMNEELDDMEPTAADINKKDSVASLATKLSKTNQEMKTVVNQWKKAEGKEKEELLNRLKTLTKIKKELEGLL